MTVRAAYGMYGDRWHMFRPQQNEFSQPFGGTIKRPAGRERKSYQSMANEPGGNPAPDSPCRDRHRPLARETPLLRGWQPPFSLQTTDYKPMYVNQWNLNGAKATRPGLAGERELPGQQQIHMITSESVNPAVFMGLGSCTLPSNGVSYPVCSTVAIKPSGESTLWRIFRRDST